MRNMLTRIALTVAVGVSGGLGAAIAAPGSAQAAPCGYYVNGDRGYIRNCASYAQWGKAVFYSGRKQCMWLRSGAEADFGYDRNIEWGALVGRGDC
jgi:hypothetical protein